MCAGRNFLALNGKGLAQRAPRLIVARRVGEKAREKFAAALCAGGVGLW